MTRKLKTLGLALVAVLALTAVMASAASAQFTSDKAETTLSGTQSGSHEFTAGSGLPWIECSTATFHGTQKGTNASSVTVKPTYSGCKDSFGRLVDITKNTLEYHFTRTGTSGGTPIGSFHLTGEIILTITTGGTHCTMIVKGSQTLGGVTYHNLGGTKGVEMTINASGIHSTVQGTPFACGLFGASYPITSTEGTYTGGIVLTGTGVDDKKAATISVH